MPNRCLAIFAISQNFHHFSHFGAAILLLVGGPSCVDRDTAKASHYMARSSRGAALLLNGSHGARSWQWPRVGSCRRQHRRLGPPLRLARLLSSRAAAADCSSDDLAKGLVASTTRTSSFGSLSRLLSLPPLSTTEPSCSGHRQRWQRWWWHCTERWGGGMPSGPPPQAGGPQQVALATASRPMTAMPLAPDAPPSLPRRGILVRLNAKKRWKSCEMANIAKQRFGIGWE